MTWNNIIWRARPLFPLPDAPAKGMEGYNSTGDTDPSYTVKSKEFVMLRQKLRSASKQS